MLWCKAIMLLRALSVAGLTWSFASSAWYFLNSSLLCFSKRSIVWALMFASTRILYCTWIRGPWFAGGPKCLLTRSHSDTLRQPLGEFERFAALQATCVAARRDQSAKRAHPLRSQRSLFRRVRRKQLRKPICHESKPSTQAIAEPTNIDFHRLPSLHLAGQPYDPSLPRDLGTVSRRANRQLYDDRSSAAILCQIAHISAD